MAPSDSLPSLPAEIWDSAWNMVRAQEDLKSLSLTCRLFRSICQELLFNEVHFSSAPPSISLGTIPSENPTPESAESNSTYSRWEEHIKRHLHRLEGLSHHPVHRYSVKTVKFHGINNDHPFPQERVSELHRALISSYVLALEIFTNLRSVYLGPSIAINDDIVHALSSLANLDELQVHGPCSISIASPTIEVKMLTLSEPDAPHEDVVSGLDLCSDRRMTSLTVSDGIIHAETLLRHELAQARPEGNLLTHLVLTVKVTQLAMVFSFLERCRNLECITLSPVSDNGDIPTLPSLRTDSMPRLASYTGPFFLARMILPGRPVTDIKILCIDDFPTIGDMIYIVEMDINEDDILRTLLQISAPVRHFRMIYLTLSGKILEFLSQRLPELQTLEVGLDIETRKRDEVLMAWDDHRLLVSLGENGCDPMDFNLTLDNSDAGSEHTDSLKAILKDVCRGRLPLPKGLVSIKFMFLCKPGYQLLTIPEERAIVSTLSRLYPSLRLIAFGFWEHRVGVRHWFRNSGNGRWKPYYTLAQPIVEAQTEEN